MARKSPRPKSQQPESRVILVDLTRADWKPIDPRKRSVEVEQCIAFLSERIRGQPKGIEAIADAYELYLSGEQDPRYPICKFLFLRRERKFVKLKRPIFHFKGLSERQ